MTRRKALRTGLAVSGGLVLGSSMGGTVGANAGLSVRAVPISLFVRAADDADPSPMPDPQDLLVNRAGDYPIDDGSTVGLDGSHQLTWGAFRAIQGKARLVEMAGGTAVDIKLSGLIPGGVYTVWVVKFAPPGFDGSTRDIATALANVNGLGSLGANDGSENSLRVSGSSGRLSVFHPNGALSVFGNVPDGLTNGYETHLVAAVHLDGQTYGPFPDGDGTGATIVEHAAFIFGTGV